MANNPYRPFSSFDMLLYTKVDMKMNNGMGKVVAKAVPIETNAYFRFIGMMACRHADGINWWLLKQGKKNNIIYKYLVTQDSVYKMDTQSFAHPNWAEGDVIGQLIFNSQGTQLAQVIYGNKQLFLANFNRCTGKITNPKIYNVPQYYKWDSLIQILDTLITSVCFSPNDSLLYVSTEYNIHQLDLYDTESLSPWYRVANLDTNVWNYFRIYCGLHNGPVGKIYIGNWNWAKAWSVIKEPNKKGGACDFRPKYIRFRGANNPPTMPNYALGKDTTQPCTPLGEVTYTEPGEAWVVYPNPANGVFYIKNKTGKRKYLYNTLRQLIRTTQTNEMDIRGVNPGVYYVQCDGETRKVIIE
jgi:hypothetical protein